MNIGESPTRRPCPTCGTLFSSRGKRICEHCRKPTTQHKVYANQRPRAQDREKAAGWAKTLRHLKEFTYSDAAGVWGVELRPEGLARVNLLVFLGMVAGRGAGKFGWVEENEPGWGI